MFIREMQPARPLIVGEAQSSTGGEPICGRIGASLAAMAGMTVEEFLAVFDRVNVLRRFAGKPERGQKGHPFPPDAARRSATRMRIAGRTVVMLGKRVALAFGLRDPPWLTEIRVRGASVFVIPHPSGIVRWYNDSAHRQAVGRLLRKLLVRKRTETRSTCR